jgi:mono/diheme cytochrome c family protein
MKHAVHISLLAGLLLVTPAALAQAGNPDRGRVEAERLCKECHQVEDAPQPWVAMPGPAFSAVARTKGMTAMALSVWFQTSHPTMPNINLKPDVRADIIAYILSLKPQTL